MQCNSVLKLFHLCSMTLEGAFGPGLQMLGIILFVLVFTIFIHLILNQLQLRFQNQQRAWALSFVSSLKKPLSVYVWVVAILCSLDILSESILGYPISGLHLVLKLGAVVVFGWFLLRWNDAAVKNMMVMSQNRRITMTPSKLDLMSKIITIGVILLTIFLLMDVTGSSVQTLVAFGGIGGLALAFASQQVISNFFGGIMVYITQPFSIGEVVMIPEKKIEGHIEEIGWYMTRIRNNEKRPIYVPNSIFTQTIVITPSRKSHERFFHTIGLRYSDIGVIKKVIDEIKDMLAQHAHVDHHQKVEVFFINFGPHSLIVEVSAFISATRNSDFPGIRQELLLTIADIVSKNGAAIAIPTSIIEFLPSKFPVDPGLTAG